MCAYVCDCVCVYLNHREALARKLFKLSMKLKHSLNCYIHMLKCYKTTTKERKTLHKQIQNRPSGKDNNIEREQIKVCEG